MIELTKYSLVYETYTADLNAARDVGPVFPQQNNLPLINPALNPADNDQFTQMSFFHRQFVN